MPRTLPASISSKVGTNYSVRFLWLVEWLLPGNSKFYSSGQSVTFGGNTYEANRVQSISGLTAQYIDRSRREFGDITIRFDNLANDGSSNFPFTLLDAAQVFEDAIVKIHLFDVDANDGVSTVWFGHSKRPTFNSDKTVDLNASFLWDSSDLVVPAKRLEQASFSTLETNRNIANDEERDDTIPLIFGVSSFKIRPVIYAARVENGYLHVNFVVSGTQTGAPFASNDVLGCVLFETTQATEVEFLTGTSGQTAPGNLTRFPDGQAHPLIAYGYAAFPITDNQKSDVENLKSDDIKLRLQNGRPILDTSLPSENPVLILKDVLRDPNYGLGLSSTAFDSTAVTNAANYVASRYQVRVELREQEPLTDFIQRILGDCHCFITFNSGLIQIRHKSGAEASVATFASSDSGQSGRVIHDDEVEVWEEDFSEVVNQVEYEFRKKNRHRRRAILFDPTAQGRAGGNIKKIVSEEVESFLWDENQAKISAAIWVREEQSQNLFIRFKTPLLEGLSVAPGDLITVHSPDIYNNASNRFFRVIAQTFDTGEEPLCEFECQIYKPAVYDDSTAGLGVDLLRGSRDTSVQGRPPDVTPGTLQVADITANDTEGKNATIRATWTYPVVDLATERTDNIFREYPIAALQLWWKYTDESIHQARLGGEARYPTATLDFEVDYKKNKSIEVFFVALGHNRSRGPLGFIPDETKEMWLTANLTATAVTASVNATTVTAVDDFIFIENEICKVASKTSNSITFVSSGGNRAPQLNTTAIAHPIGTELTVAKQSYPSLILSLTPARFTYPVVAGVVARRRDDGVRIKWNDVSADNQEKYLLYWSTDADAGSNVNKLGSATPTWYTTDPDSPPVGINLVKVDGLAHLILHEDIGVIGTTVRARVAARNGKRNYSSTLSGLVSNNQLGDAAAANWLANTNQATATQAGIVFAITKKHCGARWDIPAFLTNGGSPPTSSLRYRVFVRDGSAAPDTNNVFLNPKDPANPVSIVNPGAFFEVDTNEFELRIRRKDYAATFRNNGLRLSIAAINTVNGVETVGPLTQYTVVVQIGADPAEGDTDVAGAPTFELIEFYGAIHVHLRPPSTNGNTVLEYQVALVATTAGSATAPTSADPPLAGSVNDTIKKVVKSDGFVSLGSPKATRWVFARCRNTESPATGGPGNNGWSAWSAGQSVATARPIQDFIGDGVPDVPTSGNTGSTNFDGTGTTGGTPIRQWLDGDTLEDVIEIILPTGQNAFSLTAIDVEIVRKNNGAVKFRSEVPISTTPVYRFKAPSAYNPMARVRFRNMFREGGSDGWSAWSKYVQCKQSADAATYDPGASPPPTGDIFGEGNYPGRYNLF